jgi:hypothetical protein
MQLDESQMQHNTNGVFNFDNLRDELKREMMLIKNNLLVGQILPGENASDATDYIISILEVLCFEITKLMPHVPYQIPGSILMIYNSAAITHLIRCNGGLEGNIGQKFVKIEIIIKKTLREISEQCLSMAKQMYEEFKKEQEEIDRNSKEFEEVLNKHSRNDTGDESLVNKYVLLDVRLSEANSMQRMSGNIDMKTVKIYQKLADTYHGAREKMFETLVHHYKNNELNQRIIVCFCKLGEFQLFIKQHKTIENNTLIEFMRSSAIGLHQMHKAGIVHNDIQYSSFLVDTNDYIVTPYSRLFLRITNFTKAIETRDLSLFGGDCHKYKKFCFKLINDCIGPDIILKHKIRKIVGQSRDIGELVAEFEQLGNWMGDIYGDWFIIMPSVIHNIMLNYLC